MSRLGRKDRGSQRCRRRESPQQVQRAISTAKESIADSADSIRQQAQRVAGSADDFVRDSPWQAVGIAALIGVLVGLVATAVLGNTHEHALVLPKAAPVLLRHSLPMLNWRRWTSPRRSARSRTAAGFGDSGSQHPVRAADGVLGRGGRNLEYT